MMPVLASEDGGGGHGNSEGRKLSAPISPVIEAWVRSLHGVSGAAEPDVSGVGDNER